MLSRLSARPDVRKISIISRGTARQIVVPAPDSSIRGQASAGTHFDLDGRNMDSRFRGNDGDVANVPDTTQTPADAVSGQRRAKSILTRIQKISDTFFPH